MIEKVGLHHPYYEAVHKKIAQVKLKENARNVRLFLKNFKKPKYSAKKVLVKWHCKFLSF